MLLLLAAELDAELRKAQAERRAGLVSLTDFSASEFDAALYGSTAPTAQSHIAELDDEPEESSSGRGRSGGSHPATRAGSLPQRMLAEMAGGEGDSVDPMAAYRTAHGSGLVNSRIADREDKYHARGRVRQLSPERGGDAFDGKTPARGYADIMAAAALAREKAELLHKLEKQRQDGTLVPASMAAPAAARTAAAGAAADAGGSLAHSLSSSSTTAASSAAGAASGAAAAGAGSGGGSLRPKRRRWDDAASTSGSSTVIGGDAESVVTTSSSAPASRFSSASGAAGAAAAAAAPGGSSRWDDAATPLRAGSVNEYDTDGDDRLSVGAASLRSSAAAAAASTAAAASGAAAAARRSRRWDATPADAAAAAGGATPLRYSSSGGGSGGIGSDAWESTPGRGSGGGFAGPDGSEAAAASAAAAAAARKRSRWDETPAGGLVGSSSTLLGSATPGHSGALGASATPSGASALGSATPYGGGGSGYVGATPTPSGLDASAQTPAMGSRLGSGGGVPSTPAARIEADIEARNQPFTDEDLDALLPAKGYKVVEAPVSYVPLRTPSRKLTATPSPFSTPGFMLTKTPARDAYGIPATPGEAARADGGTGAALPFVRPEDEQYFGKLMDGTVKAEDLTPEERVERHIMTLLLKIKNGTPPQRKVAMKQITEKARDFGAGPLFNQILPLLMSPTLEDQERHLLVKLIDRLLFRLEDRVRPFVHKLLVVIEPMLIDEVRVWCGVNFCIAVVNTMHVSSLSFSFIPQRAYLAGLLRAHRHYHPLCPCSLRVCHHCRTTTHASKAERSSRTYPRPRASPR